MNRRTFLGLLAGSVLFPGVPEPNQWVEWKKAVLKPVAGYHQRNFFANAYMQSVGQGVNDFYLASFKGAYRP